MNNIKFKILRLLKTVISYLDNKFKVLKNKHLKLTKPTVKDILSFIYIQRKIKHSIPSLLPEVVKGSKEAVRTGLNGKDTSDLVLRKGWVSTQVNSLFAMSLIKKTFIINFIRRFYNLICNSYFFIYLFLLALILFYVKFYYSVVEVCMLLYTFFFSFILCTLIYKIDILNKFTDSKGLKGFLINFFIDYFAFYLIFFFLIISSLTFILLYSSFG